MGRLGARGAPTAFLCPPPPVVNGCVFHCLRAPPGLTRPFDRDGGEASNDAVPSFVVAAADRDWFGRCRRAWDFGARARRALEAAPAEGDRLEQAVRAALAVHYFPGMWQWDRTIVAPLVLAAFADAGGRDIERPVIEAFQRWSSRADEFTPMRIEADIDVHVPDDDCPGDDLATAEGVGGH